MEMLRNPAEEGTILTLGTVGPNEVENTAPQISEGHSQGSILTKGTPETAIEAILLAVWRLIFAIGGRGDSNERTKDRFAWDGEGQKTGFTFHLDADQKRRTTRWYMLQKDDPWVAINDGSISVRFHDATTGQRTFFPRFLLPQEAKTDDTTLDNMFYQEIAEAVAWLFQSISKGETPIDLAAVDHFDEEQVWVICMRGTKSHITRFVFKPEYIDALVHGVDLDDLYLHAYRSKELDWAVPEEAAQALDEFLQVLSWQRSLRSAHFSTVLKDIGPSSTMF
ncbi:hypothetical protein BT69DRAFT_1289570 [Atractiella rhizophila]|nr:hypothetical protein BT69DRAFT_1289570 [Atractiella rhizophila]